MQSKSVLIQGGSLLKEYLLLVETFNSFSSSNKSKTYGNFPSHTDMKQEKKNMKNPRSVRVVTKRLVLGKLKRNIFQAKYEFNFKHVHFEKTIQ